MQVVAVRVLDGVAVVVVGVVVLVLVRSLVSALVQVQVAFAPPDSLPQPILLYRRIHHVILLPLQ